MLFTNGSCEGSARRHARPRRARRGAGVGGAAAAPEDVQPAGGSVLPTFGASRRPNEGRGGGEAGGRGAPARRGVWTVSGDGPDDGPAGRPVGGPRSGADAARGDRDGSQGSAGGSG